jgi:hypothetical protein
MWYVNFKYSESTQWHEDTFKTEAEAVEAAMDYVKDGFIVRMGEE